MLARMLQAEGRGLTIIFSRTKRTAAKVADELADRGFAAAAIHGDLGQGAREQALRAFRNGKVDILVATDVAARGIDVENVTHVINYQCPEDEKTYLHRIGRTARAGNTGIAVTFVDWDDMPRWGLINKTLDLGIPEPAGDLLLLRRTSTTSSTSRPAAKGRLPKAEQTREGLDAEVLEDLGETGKGSGRGGAARGRSGGPPPSAPHRTARPPTALLRPLLGAVLLGPVALTRAAPGERPTGEAPRAAVEASRSPRPATATAPRADGDQPRRSRSRRRTRGGRSGGRRQRLSRRTDTTRPRGLPGTVPRQPPRAWCAGPYGNPGPPSGAASEAREEPCGDVAVGLGALGVREVVRMERPTAGASANRTVLGIGGSSTGSS